MASTPATILVFLVVTSLFSLIGCGREEAFTSVNPAGASAGNDEPPHPDAPRESAVSALQRTLSDLEARLSRTRAKASRTATQATSLSTSCDRAVAAGRDLETSLAEITDYAARVASLNQRRSAEIEGDALVSEGRATSVTEQIRNRVTTREAELQTAENRLADEERNLLTAPASETAMARARRDTAASLVSEAHRNLDAERANLAQSEGALNNIAGRREESARRLLSDAAALDAELECTEDRVTAAIAAVESCTSI